ncbi:penicillin-binding protein activator LpoB [Undibacterium curvum]|uniref:Penicillin-binding protein activator LpoB n=1 Tax=Undibacterium curvum TaxID=2762294 RepID=A0ABR7A679_9BURK|nr:penicillin-binding protein activator LpoB [Undibacterium curvum]MBC3932319.1 penicillin-binding protein activator LpoB [Undibacterium curvum]
MLNLKKMIAALACGLASISAYAAEPKIAVTDLTYEEKVSEYFRVVSASSKSSVKGSYSERETDRSYSQRGHVDAKSESNYFEAEGYYTYIDRGELKTYTADLKGALLKGGAVHLIQARPYVGKPMEKIFDIIGRIKQGMYPGADYVLFGTVSNIQFRQESNQLQYGNSMTASLSLDLVADFSLINTKTYEVKAAFSASGSGVDTKIISRAGDRVVFNRGKVMQETSRSLAEAAYGELMVQFGLPRGANRPANAGTAAQPVVTPAPEPVTVYR